VASHHRTPNSRWGEPAARVSGQYQRTNHYIPQPDGKRRAAYATVWPMPRRWVREPSACADWTGGDAAEQKSPSRDALLRRLAVDRAPPCRWESAPWRFAICATRALGLRDSPSGVRRYSLGNRIRAKQTGCRLCPSPPFESPEGSTTPTLGCYAGRISESPRGRRTACGR